MLNPRKFPTNTNTQHITTLRHAKQRENLPPSRTSNREKREGLFHARHWTALGAIWMFYALPFLVPIEQFDVIATITIYWAL